MATIQAAMNDAGFWAGEEDEADQGTHGWLLTVTVGPTAGRRGHGRDAASVETRP
jgi:hypothetical protein